MIRTSEQRRASATRYRVLRVGVALRDLVRESSLYTITYQVSNFSMLILQYGLCKSSFR